MKKLFKFPKIITFSLFILFASLHNSCKKDNILKVTDASGNIYHTVKIGDQIWTVENLRTTKYRDGSDIINIVNDAEWSTTTEGGYCKNPNIPDYVKTYGYIYNWYAIDNSKGHNIAPDGWHVPTKQEWEKLILYLGGVDQAAGKLKEAGLSHWLIINEGADNSSGFTGLPGGLRSGYDGLFEDINKIGYYWTSTQASNADAYNLYLTYNINFMGNDFDKKTFGMSVRLIKNAN